MFPTLLLSSVGVKTIPEIRASHTASPRLLGVKLKVEHRKENFIQWGHTGKRDKD